MHIYLIYVNYISFFSAVVLLNCIIFHIGTLPCSSLLVVKGAFWLNHGLAWVADGLFDILHKSALRAG